MNPECLGPMSMSRSPDDLPTSRPPPILSQSTPKTSLPTLLSPRIKLHHPTKFTSQPPPPFITSPLALLGHRPEPARAPHQQGSGKVETTENKTRARQPTHLFVRSLYSTRCPHSLHRIASPRFNATLLAHSPQIYVTEICAASAGAPYEGV